LRADPRHHDAQLGLINALTAGRRFDEAERELDTATGVVLDEAEAALIQARLHSLRAGHRLESAGEMADVELCDAVLKEEMEPAIALVEEQKDRAPEPARAQNLLGDLYMQSSRILLHKFQILRESAALAADLGREEDAAHSRAEALSLIPNVGRNQQSAMQAYERAIELDPEFIPPRLAVARHALSSFVPRPERARAVLEPVIEQRPEHRAARESLALAATLAGDYDEALAHIEAVEREGEEDTDLLMTRAHVLAEAERWEEAAPLTERLLELQPNDATVNYLRGKALLESGEPGQAVAFLQRSVSAARQPQPEALFALAQGLRRQGNREQAISAFRQLLEGTGEELVQNVRHGRRLSEMRYSALMALAEELGDEDPVASAEYAVSALKLFPARREAYEQARKTWKMADLAPAGLEDIALVHAAGHLATGDLEEALEVCREAAGEAQESPTWRLRLLQARLLARKGAYREAAEVYEALRGEAPDSRPTYELAALHIQLGHLDEAEAVLRSLLEASPGDRRAVSGLVEVLLRKGEPEQARSALRAAEEQLGTTATLALLLRLSLQTGQLGEAVKVARSVVEAEPESAPARVLLAELLWRSEDYEAAREAFDRAVELNPEYGRAYNRALLDLQRGREEQAAELLRKAVERLPDQLTPRFYLAVTLQRQGRPGEAREALQAILEDSRTRRAAADLVAWSLAALEAGQGNLEKALQLNQRVGRSEFGFRGDRRALLEQLAGAGPPASVEAAGAMNLLVAYNRSGHTQPMLEQIRTVNELLPNQPLPRCMYANALDKQGQHEEAVAEYRRVIEGNPDFLFARISLATSHMRADENAEAARLLEDAIALADPERAAQVHLLLGQLYEKENRLEKAVFSYRAAMKHPAVAAVACNNLAYLLATRKGDVAGALPLARQAVELAGPVPAYLDTLGWVHYLQGNTEEAVRFLEGARQGLPQVPTVRYHLGMAYLKAGRHAEAREELEEALAISRSFPEAEAAQAALQSL
ncbi:MAG: tetratricopeptide repeat protein, partial [Candidatus Brocadiaceae bacterium]